MTQEPNLEEFCSEFVQADQKGLCGSCPTAQYAVQCFPAIHMRLYMCQDRPLSTPDFSDDSSLRLRRSQSAIVCCLA